MINLITLANKNIKKLMERSSKLTSLKDLDNFISKLKKKNEYTIFWSF